MRTFTFDGVKSDTYFLTNKIKLSVLPDLDFDTVKIAGRNGVIPFTSQLGAREFEVGVTIMGSSQADIRSKCRLIAKWLFTPTDRLLSFSDEPSISYYVRVKGALDLTELANMGSTTIKFFASDPYGYGATKNNSGASPNIIINNAGTAPTYPTFIVTPSVSVSVISLTNNVTGKYLYIAGSGSPFTAGKAITIDMNRNYVKDNTTQNSLMAYVTVDTDFWALQVGNNSIQTSSNLTITESHVERFY